MPSEKTIAAKQEIVTALAQEFRDAQTLIVGEYGGLNVAQDTEMRADMRANGVKYKVVKNTLASRAAAEAGFPELEDLFTGKSIVAYSSEDVVAPARLIKKYADKHELIKIKGGVMEGAVAELETLQKLAAIPDRETLIQRVVSGIAAPLSGLAIYLNAIREKMEEQGAQTAADVYEGAKSEDAEDSSEAVETAPAVEEAAEAQATEEAPAEASAPAEETTEE